MAKVEISVIQALRKTIDLLAQSQTYQWGHMGQCNCGFLAQVVTGKTATEIHTTAMQGYGDWSEQLHDYCPTTGMPMDQLIGELLEKGFDRDDLAQLERLSNPEIRSQMSTAGQTVQHNNKEHVVAYLRTWANLLEEAWLRKQKIDLHSFINDLQLIHSADS